MKTLSASILFMPIKSSFFLDTEPTNQGTNYILMILNSTLRLISRPSSSSSLETIGLVSP